MAGVATCLASSENYAVQLSAVVRSDPPAITLSWIQTDSTTPLSYSIQRKRAGAGAWEPATALPGSATQFVDGAIEYGTAYEYQVVRSMPTYKAYGYIQSGIGVPLVDSRGRVVLLVEREIATPLAVEIARLEGDLVGDGWTVRRHDVVRTDSVAAVKALIVREYAADPASLQAVFLLGHVPVPYAGRIAPDGHSDHLGAWPADVYYGDIDGNWTDTYVDYVQPGSARLSNVPGDGKFDQAGSPSAVELQVGRVDLAHLPGRVAGVPTFPDEVALLRQYLNKNHAFRHGQFQPQRRAVVGDYFGPMDGEAFAASGYRSFAPLVGPREIVNLNSQYGNTAGVWIPTLAANAHLLAYGCGPGSFTSVGGIGSTTDIVHRNVRSVFTLMCGSYFGDWDTEDNVLRGLLATPEAGLAAVWSGRPHWFLHPMGLGETIGYSARLVQNNAAAAYRNQVMTASGLVSIALMGDPTLRLHPIAPPLTLTGSLSAAGVALTWSGSTEAVTGYHVYRSTSASGPFTRLTIQPLTDTRFTDPDGTTGLTYMVRASRLELTPSGSYENASQGILWSTGGALPDSIPPTVTFMSPSAGSVVSGNAVGIAVTATDNVGVVAVQFEIDGRPFGNELTAAPFAATWDSTLAADGSHTLSATARDAAGNRISSSMTLLTANSTPSPSAGGTGSTGSATHWVDDALPASAAMFASGGDVWNWVTGNPVAFSGSTAHQSSTAKGFHEHGFANAKTSWTVDAGDTLFVHVWLDPLNPPSEIMLSWQAENWEHRAYWGANRIDQGKPGSASRRHMGKLPPLGKWVMLSVPAADVALEGRTVSGMAFALFDGRATWDFAGKVSRDSSARR